MTMTAETYNGWTNRETWAFMLHIDNDQALSEMAREAVRTAAEGAEWSPAMPDDESDEVMRTAYVRTCAADALKDWAESLFTRNGYTDETGNTWPDGLADAAAEIGSLWRVNWAECVDALAGEQDQ